MSERYIQRDVLYRLVQTRRISDDADAVARIEMRYYGRIIYISVFLLYLFGQKGYGILRINKFLLAELDLARSFDPASAEIDIEKIFILFTLFKQPFSKLLTSFRLSLIEEYIFSLILSSLRRLS